MLCLLRRRGESLQIGPDVFVTVLSVKGGSVRLGITAPPATSILRSELSAPLTTAEPISATPPPPRAAP